MAQRKTAYCPDDRQGEYDEAYYQDILDGINIGYTEFDLDGNITFFNNRVETMSSRSREELIGMHYTQYMDENAAKEAYRVFHEVYLTGIPKNKYIKELVWESEFKGFEEYVKKEVEAQMICGGTDDFAEGVSAFNEKRRASFK